MSKFNNVFNLVAFNRSRKRRLAKCKSICYSCENCSMHCFSEEDQIKKAQAEAELRAKAELEAKAKAEAEAKAKAEAEAKAK